MLMLEIFLLNVSGNGNCQASCCLNDPLIIRRPAFVLPRCDAHNALETGGDRARQADRAGSQTARNGFELSYCEADVGI